MGWNGDQNREQLQLSWQTWTELTPADTPFAFEKIRYSHKHLEWCVNPRGWQKWKHEKLGA